MISRARFRLILVSAMLIGFMPMQWAHAVLTIEVNKGVEAGIPIAVVPFSFEGVAATGDRPADIIESNLASSGRFEPVFRGDFISTPHDLNSVQFKDWRLLKTEALVVGRVINVGNNRYEVRFRLIDVFREKQLVGQKFVVPANRLRKVSHQISDIIYKELTGIPGAFDTKIAYITVKGQSPKNRYLLQIADSDGFGAKTVLESTEPILSPAWSPDGSKLAYVSFEKKRSMIFVQDIWTGERKRVSDSAGINSAPSWSPDGTRLTMTLSKDGNPEIYVYQIATERLQRITRHTSIDTEPSWAPNGNSIIFTSGRSGAPQIYRVAASGGQAQRLTFNGNYNAGASYSNDGKNIVLITNQGNGFRVGLYSTEDRTVTELTSGRQDESPSFAPNGEMIMYATQKGGRSVLAAVSVDGKIQQTLRFQNGSVREPAWSPYNRKL